MKQIPKTVVLTSMALGFFSASASATTDFPPVTLFDLFGGYTLPAIFLEPNIDYSFTGIVPAGGAIADKWSFVDGYNSYSGYTYKLTDLSQPGKQINGLAANLDLVTYWWNPAPQSWLSGGPLDTVVLGTHASFAGDGSPNRYSVHPSDSGAQYVQYNLVKLDISGFAPEGGKFRIDAVRDIPEPGTYALMLAGLGMLGFAGSAKKGRHRLIIGA